MPASAKHLVQQGGSPEDEGMGTSDEDTGAASELEIDAGYDQELLGKPDDETGATIEELDGLSEDEIAPASEDEIPAEDDAARDEDGKPELELLGTAQ